MIDHTVKSYDKELDTLERRIAEMGGIAEKMVVDAMDSLASFCRETQIFAREKHDFPANCGLA